MSRKRDLSIRTGRLMYSKVVQAVDSWISPWDSRIEGWTNQFYDSFRAVVLDMDKRSLRAQQSREDAESVHIPLQMNSRARGLPRRLVAGGISTRQSRTCLSQASTSRPEEQFTTIIIVVDVVVMLIFDTQCTHHRSCHVMYDCCAFAPKKFGKLPTKNIISRNYKITNERLSGAKELVQNVSSRGQVSQSIMAASARGIVV